MDPNENLKRQLALAKQIIDRFDNDRGIPGDLAVDLADLVLSLDEWLKRGGFAPSRWTKKR